MLTEEAAFKFGCDLKERGVDKTQAEKDLHSACGIRWHTMNAPSSPNPEDNITYEYFCPEIDPPSAICDAFWNGYYNY